MHNSLFQYFKNKTNSVMAFFGYQIKKIPDRAGLFDGIKGERKLHNKKSIFYLSSSKFENNRFKQIYESEPETIAWIDNFDKNSVFWDIGANIGIFSLYASMIHNNCSVLSFEPESVNFSKLTKNILLNKLNINAYPIAIYSKTSLTKLYLSNNYTESGALHSINLPRSPNGKCKKFKFNQGSISISPDDLISKFNIKKPTHIKIDIDGFEHKVIKSLDKYLNIIESIIVELDLKRDEHRKVINIMLKKGFFISKNLQDKTTIKGSIHKDMVNMIFHKNKNKLKEIEKNYDEYI